MLIFYHIAHPEPRRRVSDGINSLWNSVKKFLLLIFFVSQLIGYNQPNTLNLGFTNILEGGPIRPHPGFYWYQYLEYYQAHNFLDNAGKPIGCVRGPNFDTMWGCSEFIYQTKSNPTLHACFGIDLQVYYVFGSKIQKNSLGFSDSGRGFSDPYLGIFIQWDPIMKGEQPLFVHRLELGSSYPAGKFKRGYFFNPGNGCYYINPNWAATLYLTPHLAVSTTLNYVWSSQRKYTGVQPGQAIFLNYSMEYECLKNFWLSACGYYLGQYTDDKLYGVPIPKSREQVFAIGPGALYSVSDDLSFFSYFYFEKKVKNRSQGINFFLRSVVHF
jgi:anthranilate 1,2-dioxygenase (deaminating, decarboxylating) large subunit